MIVEQIAEIIRRVDGDNSMGAAALAEAIVSELGLQDVYTATGDPTVIMQDRS